MSNATACHTPVQIVHRPGRVFETLGDDEHWAQGGYEEGHTVECNTASAESMLVEVSFVLPRLPQDEPGKYPILTIARDRPARTEPDVFLHLLYEPFEKRFLIASNVGTKSSELQTFALEGAPGAKYTQRVLRLLVLVNRNGLFPSIEDPLTGQREVFGEFALANRSRCETWGSSSRKQASRKGTWRIRSGAESECDDEERSFPAGFGLSDLRIHLFSDSSEDFKTLPYSGELDHLASDSWDDVNPFGLEDGPEDDGWDFGDEEPLSEEPMSQALLGLAEHIFTLAGGVNTWAHRARGLAEDTQHLALRLTEEREATEAWTHTP